MIERFNFYDVYGYLIPGFVWLMLLAVPFHLLFNFRALSASEFTAGLVLAYLAGHLLAGLARRFLRSEKFEIPVGGEKKAVYRSVAVLWDEYRYADKLPPSLKSALAEKFEARFGYDPLTPFNPDEIRQMFFLCRTSLAQAKLGSYVEQYQGMTSLTRSLSLAFCTVAISYSTWALMGAWHTHSTRVQSIAVAIIGLGVVAAIIINTAHQEDAAGEKRTLSAFSVTIEQQAFVALFMVVAIAFSSWRPLSARQCYGLAAGAGVSWLIALRLRTAAESFDESLVSAVYRDFIALEAGRDDRKPKPYCKPDDD